MRITEGVAALAARTALIVRWDDTRNSRLRV